LLATLPEFAELASLERMPEAGLLDKRVFLIPQSELLATLTSTKEELILRRVNLTAEMDKRDVNYLFVASQAVRVAKKGDTYRYAIDAKSKKGGLVYKVESGPADLSVSSAGLVTWSVPASAQPEASVIISIHDVSGQEIYHSFRITVR
jgi:hypothetical protein